MIYIVGKVYFIQHFTHEYRFNEEDTKIVLKTYNNKTTTMYERT